DEIVELGALRAWLVALVEMSYQATGRRVKNPRIWSLHDLDALFGASAQQAAPAAEQAEAPSARAAAEVEGTVFRAPMAGRFYTRASPDAAPFVAPGDALARGQVVGLIEVMKTFHRLSYGGEGLPERARVVQLLVEDGDDVA